MTEPAPPKSAMIIQVAGCVLQDIDGRILLLHRNTERRVHWELPGGKHEPGETAAIAAAREIAEELAVEVCNLVELGGVDLISDIDGQAYRFTWFTAECTGGQTPRIAEPHTFDGLQYFSVEELAVRDDLSANMQALLSQIQAKQVTL